MKKNGKGFIFIFKGSKLVIIAINANLIQIKQFKTNFMKQFILITFRFSKNYNNYFQT